MILVAEFGLIVMVLVGALRTMPRGRGPKVYLAVSLMPLLLTLVLPLPLAMAEGGENDWTRQTVIILSRAGLDLSFVLFPIGVVLSLWAAFARDRAKAVLLARETVLAAVPAAIIGFWWVLARLM